MLRTMARGDECKTADRANYACKSFDVSAPMQKTAYEAPKYTQAPMKQKEKSEQKKDYGAWGAIYKDKKTFTDLHLC